MAIRPHVKHTHVYKSDKATDIHLDVYLAANTGSSESPKPVILWFHGGYLVTGSRAAIPSWFLNYAIAHEWTLVSADYRVLPESTGFATTEDAIAAYEWVATSLIGLHPECHADPRRIIVAGASAGGWCTLVSALSLSKSSQNGIPRPKALFLLYPFTDPGSEKWAQSLSLPDTTVDQAMAQKLLDEIPRRIAQGDTSLGEDFPKSEAELLTRKRLPLLYAILERGIFLDYLTGLSGFGRQVMSVGLENAVDERAKGLFPLDFGSFGPSFPATVVVHGTADREISCQESEKLVAKLKEGSAAVQYYPVPGADHVFELELDECHPDAGAQDSSSILLRALQALQGYVNA
ncbi:hypothetical protein UA08_02313 [Talaromyces atroroseus]|uniref:Alpha/beta hydrolase fold-3 domain-containing protein n=1 Tax=Talaromyces atroroseus TaxID=1441469 RepID=A0A225B798_TALAT|nr:hypothetical protein UA08_02313 [Talaromyces atroroseus]OKL61797.1 hypothetical protein UA08_02313 [Talaromyces atroroseus]